MREAKTFVFLPEPGAWAPPQLLEHLALQGSDLRSAEKRWGPADRPTPDDAVERYRYAAR